MAIICGIDFSPASEAACRVAALLAERDEPLVLVHAITPFTLAGPAEYQSGTMIEEIRTSVDRAMGDFAVRLGGRIHEATRRVEFGEADELVLAEAEKAGARLVVVGSVGQRGLKSLLGSHADRIASRSRVPVLVVRGDFPAAEWLAQERPLRVAVAAELGPSTEPAIEWAAHLTQQGPCQFIVAHLSWPPEAYERYAIDAPMYLDRTHPVVREVVERRLSEAAARLRGTGETRIVVESNMGSTDDAIAQVAARERADLLVVGRGREEGRHWWERSVSRGVIRSAPMSVVCVPDVADETHLPDAHIRRVVAATDFSPLGNSAVAYACSLVPEGGEILLVHALDDEEMPAAERGRRREQLEDYGRNASGKAKVTVQLLTGDDPAHLIAAAAERFGADLICVGSRGRSGIARTLLGSVSQSILLRSRRPVLVVQSTL
ncbi:MAG: universal stress protein [Thermoanaerobaculia bacterium]